MPLNTTQPAKGAPPPPRHQGTLVAVCAHNLFAIPTGEGEAPAELLLLPADAFSGRSGKHWMLAPVAAELIVAELRAQRTALVIDYEHQTLASEKNGQPAPAAGWVETDTIEWRPGVGIVGRPTWTARARAAIAADEYRYVSPVFGHDKAGRVHALYHLALTNFPDLTDQDAVGALAAARFQPPTPSTPEEQAVERSQLIALLGLADDATDAQITEGLAALKAQADQAGALTEEVAALKAAPTKPARPDPNAYVPVAVVHELRGEIAALKGKVETDERATLIAAGQADGKLIGEAMTAWAGTLELAALRAYLDSATPIAALKGRQSETTPPPGATGTDLVSACKAQWEAQPALRAEFSSLESYTAYRRAEADGRVKIVDRGGDA